MALQTIDVHTIQELAEALAIRKKVFIEEYGVAEKQEFDSYDVDAKHILTYFNKIPVATGRLSIIKGRALIGRIAVLSDFRNRGLGKSILKHLEIMSKKYQVTEILLNTHSSLEMYYRKLGYKISSEAALVDKNLDYIIMTKVL